MRVAAHLRQNEFDVRCEWGLQGVEALAPISDVVATGATTTLAGCLRNSRAVAAYAGRIGRRVAGRPPQAGL